MDAVERQPAVRAEIRPSAGPQYVPQESMGLFSHWNS